ncbi:MAG TPA: hypothetical protein VIM53_05065 [Candidatus Saccharimonadales bacterium]
MSEFAINPMPLGGESVVTHIVDAGVAAVRGIMTVFRGGNGQPTGSERGYGRASQAELDALPAEEMRQVTILPR